MRVIAGSAGGRRLTPPRDREIRPTSDRVREALFNILGSLCGSVAGMTVLDVFAGTGALGIEALSRGAERAVFVDNGKEAQGLISQNLAAVGFTTSGRIVAKEALSALKTLEATGQQFDLVFLDPPYDRGLTGKVLEYLESSPLIDEESIIVAEFSSREAIPAAFGRLRQFDLRVYGDTAVALLKLESTD